MTKNFLLISFALGISFGLVAQTSVTKSNMTGYWQGSTFYYPNFFKYSTDKNEMEISPRLTEWLQKNNNNTEVIKAIEDTKISMPGMLADMYFSLDENNTYKSVMGGVYEEGSYTIDPPAPTANATSTEKELLDFISSYGYDKIIRLKSNSDGEKDDLYISGTNGTIVYYSKKKQSDLSGEMVTVSIRFKKTSASTAALLLSKTETAKITTANKKNTDKVNAEMAAEKKKADEKTALAHQLADDAKKNGEVFTTADKEASYPGGNSSWLTFVKQNLRRSVPLDYGAYPGTYTITVSFTVNTDGTLSNIIADNDPGYGMEKEALRVVTRSGTWVPAETAGKKVRYRTSKNIVFFVSE